jgi:hypothetical protein
MGLFGVIVNNTYRFRNALGQLLPHFCRSNLCHSTCDKLGCDLVHENAILHHIDRISACPANYFTATIFGLDVPHACRHFPASSLKLLACQRTQQAEMAVSTGSIVMELTMSEKVKVTGPSSGQKSAVFDSSILQSARFDRTQGIEH